jgi:hypothetical protein
VWQGWSRSREPRARSTFRGAAILAQPLVLRRFWAIMVVRAGERPASRATTNGLRVRQAERRTDPLKAFALHIAATGGMWMAKRKPTQRKAAKRTLVKPKGDKRYVRRSAGGRFNESDDVGRSLTRDRKRKATRKAKRGQGDRGDR